MLLWDLRGHVWNLIAEMPVMWLDQSDLFVVFAQPHSRTFGAAQRGDLMSPWNTRKYELARVPDTVYCLTNKSTDEETAAALPIPDFEFLHQEKRITGQEKAKSRTQACFYRIHMNNFHNEGAIYYRFNRTNYWNSVRLLRRWSLTEKYHDTCEFNPENWSGLNFNIYINARQKINTKTAIFTWLEPHKST